MQEGYVVSRWRIKKLMQADQKYVGDITYIHTKEGSLYLAVVIDLYSRKVVGWSMDKSMTKDLVNQALLMAIWTRKPKKGLLCILIKAANMLVSDIASYCQSMRLHKA